jgi:hypothetical protein
VADQDVCPTCGGEHPPTFTFGGRERGWHEQLPGPLPAPLRNKARRERELSRSKP